MTLEKRRYPDIVTPMADKCKMHCGKMGGSASSFNTAHGQQERLERKNKNQTSEPC